MDLTLQQDFSGTANQSSVMVDYDGHGTAVGSIIAASTGNGYGMAGLAPGSIVVPMRIGSS